MLIPTTPNPWAAMGPDILPPTKPNVGNIPPIPRPDIPDLGDVDEIEIDLPVEEEPDIDGDDTDQPEKQPDEPQEDEIGHRDDNTGETPQPLPEKHRKPEVDQPMPEPETGRRNAPTLH